ncbi:MAG: hypothetical protein JXJ20_04695 [Anaerolineae bacterium]|nr:hypothetical protein [Anaerolineae bacterium]
MNGESLPPASENGLQAGYTGQPVQIRLLTHAIRSRPGAPVNYLLRGEEWLLAGDLGRARADFVAAKTRAIRLLKDSAWGYIYQAYVDRAEAGLSQCER